MIKPIIAEVLSSLPAEACSDPSAVQQAWLDNMGRSVGGEASLGSVAAGKIKGQLSLRMARSTPRVLVLQPSAAAAAEPGDVHLQGGCCLPVEGVLRLQSAPRQASLQTLQAQSTLKPKVPATD